MTITFNPVLPAWIMVSAGVILFLALAHGTRLLIQKQGLTRWVIALGVLRAIAILLFLLCLLRPAFTRVRSIPRRPEMLALVDTSRSMAAVEPSGGTARLPQVMELLRNSPFQSECLGKFNVQWFAFDRSARPIARHELVGLKPEGETTCLADSLRAAWSFYRQKHARETDAAAPPAQILLISDGRDRGHRDISEVAQRLGLRIDVLPPPSAQAEAQPEPGLVIAGVTTPSRTLLGSASRLLVTVRQNGAGQTPLTLTLAEDGQTIMTYDFAFAPRADERRLTLTYQPTAVGIRRYSVQAAPKDAKSALRPSPPYEVSVKVENNSNNVLYLEDTWRWEFKFLRRVFENDPNFSFTGFLSRGGGLYMQFGEQDRNINLAGFPQSRAELSMFDTIVLGDVDPERWSKALAGALYDLVANSGKSLIVIAGPNIGKIVQVPELAALLPVEITPETAKPLPGPVAERISLEGAESPLFFSAPANSGIGRWPNLPPLDQIYPPLRKRPAATILLESARQANDYGRIIIAAEHTVGKGRVLFVGADTLWKWQMLAPVDAEGATPYSVFWQQALRALQPSRLTVGNVNLWLETDRTRYQSGQTVSVRADIDSDRQLERPAIEARVTLPGGRTLPLAFQPHPTQPNCYSAEFEALAAGQYQIRSTVAAGGKTVAETTVALDVTEPEPETAPGAVARAALAQIAAATGGRLIAPDDPATWPAVNAQSRPPMLETQTFDLWSEYWLIIVLVLVLGLDWIIRLMRGLV